MRLFISSTVFDLVDVRAELAEHMKAIGITPVLSDDKLSDFRIVPDANSIETCLVNVESCDEFLIILDRRYGPSLVKAGFDDVSATHLEYNHAKQLGKPIHMFVRDRTEGEFGTWRKNKGKPIDFEWVISGNEGLFDLMKEHAKLSVSAKASNWKTTFTNSVDLKAAISKRFESRLMPQRIVAAIQANLFPMIEVQAKVNEETQGDMYSRSFSLRTTFKNVGGAPAFDFKAHYDGEDVPTLTLLPGQTHSRQAVFDYTAGMRGLDSIFLVSFRSAIGVAGFQKHKIQAEISGSFIRSFCGLIESKFRRCSPIEFLIEDD